MIDQIWKLRSRAIPYKEDWILFLGSKLKLVKEYCPSVQMVREMVSVQVNWLKCNLNQNRKNSQRSSSAYCNLIKSKDDIDRLLLTTKIDQDMTLVREDLIYWSKDTHISTHPDKRMNLLALLIFKPENWKRQMWLEVSYAADFSFCNTSHCDNSQYWKQNLTPLTWFATISFSTKNIF